MLPYLCAPLLYRVSCTIHVLPPKEPGVLSVGPCSNPSCSFSSSPAYSKVHVAMLQFPNNMAARGMRKTSQWLPKARQSICALNNCKLSSNLQLHAIGIDPKHTLRTIYIYIYSQHLNNPNLKQTKSLFKLCKA